MARGPGKYDDLVQVIAAGTGAAVAFVLILEGRDGTGSALSVRDHAATRGLPAMLRGIADEMEKDFARAFGN